MQTIAVGRSPAWFRSNDGEQRRRLLHVNSRIPMNADASGAICRIAPDPMIPSALCYSFGKMIGVPGRGGFVAAMTLIFVPMLCSGPSDNPASPLIQNGGQPGSGGASARRNMEGKESAVRDCQLRHLGRFRDGCFETACISMHDSFTPIGASSHGVIKLGEVIYGGRLRPVRHDGLCHHRRLAGGSWSPTPSTWERKLNRTR